MSTGNDSILDAYLYETNTLLEQLDSIVLASEEKDTFSEEDINTIFRIMHTIKGSSAMMEYRSIMTIAHRAEDLFSIIRDKSMDIVPEANRPELFELLFQTIDFFRQEIDHIENGQPLTENIDSLLQKVNTLIQQIQNTGAPQPPSPGQAGAVAQDQPTEYPDFPYALQIFFDEGCGMENARAFMLVNAVRDICGEGNFHFSPADISTDPSTAGQIIDSGFMMYFRDAEDRENAVHAVTGAGSVRTYQAFDRPQSSSIPAPAPQALPAEQKVSAP